MKQILLSCFLFSNFFVINAQDIVAPNKRWNTVNYKWFTGNICTDIYSFRKDTIIDSKQYWQLFINDDETLEADWLPAGKLMREDGEGKVFIYEQGEDRLIYDFNLNEGDSISINYSIGSCSLVVYQIDSLTLLNGEKRKRLRLVHKDEPDYSEPNYFGYKDWVEGIGSMSDLIYYVASCGTDYPFDLLCYYENGDLVYSNPDEPNCFITPLIKLEDNPFNFEIHPNPASNLIHLTTNLEVKEVLIYNISGKLVKTTELSTINVSQFLPGIYYMIASDGQQYASKRFVVF